MIFVIQQHDASHLHYDFRLQIGRVLKSWAIPKGPSMNPKQKRLAVLVEDHALSYKNFEGIIEKGCGVGKVLLWDRGTYRNLLEKEKISMNKALKTGKIKIFIRGKKIKGDFALVKLKNSKKNWLLIKGNDAYADASYNPVKSNPKSVKSGKTLKVL